MKRKRRRTKRKERQAMEMILPSSFIPVLLAERLHAPAAVGLLRMSPSSTVSTVVAAGSRWGASCLEERAARVHARVTGINDAKSLSNFESISQI
jgi:hypothetical protein